MRDPYRWRAVGLWSLSLGALSLIAWLWLGAGRSGGIGVALLAFAVTGVLYGGMLAFFQHQNVRAKEALARGEDIIARWRWRRKIGNDSSPRNRNGRHTRTAD